MHVDLDLLGFSTSLNFFPAMTDVMQCRDFTPEDHTKKVSAWFRGHITDTDQSS